MTQSPAYMSASQLGIQPWEAEALAAFVDAARRNALGDGITIDMGSTATRLHLHCGTVCCLGGWVALHHGMSVSQAHMYVHDCYPHEVLTPLYYPLGVEGDWSEITPAEVARVTEHFLETGEVRWS